MVKPSDVIGRRATQEACKDVPVGAPVRQGDIVESALAGVLLYLDELYARGIIPLPLNPTDPWPLTPKDASGSSRRTAG